MKIQIHSSINNMSTTGRQVLGDMQDSYTPLVDLLVRESIQNSTDASKPIYSGDDTVSVSYDVTSVPNANINGLFDQITDKLNTRFPIGGQNDCLVIRDCGTFGLTGALRKIDVNDGDNLGNLIKLIYDIRKPQENSGAGGAWGLGKTVYYKLGVGIVLYYTRILQGDSYESRLAACMVEDEKDESAILPVCPLKDDLRKSGIAWWGADDGFNKTIPITDESEIHDILQRFEVRPYEGTETGTTIIVPYLNISKLMDTTRYTSGTDEGDTVINHVASVTSERPWMSDLSSFIWVTAQRWYYPRVDNKYYTEATGLRNLSLRIDGQKLTREEMFPVFRLMQSLYNRAIIDNPSNAFDDFMTEDPVKPYFEITGHQGKDKIKVNTYLQGNAGQVAYAKATQEILGMNYPDNNPSPSKFFDLDVAGEDGCAIIAYTRKPGMIVWYDVVKGLPSELGYILGHFALRSDSVVVDKNKKRVNVLEDFIRATETANHKCWNNDDYRITERIKQNVAKKVFEAFKPAPINENDGPQDTGLGRLLGRFMPPRGFGYKPAKKDKGKGGGGVKPLTGGSVRYRIEQIGLPEYSFQTVKLRYKAEIPANCNPSFEMELSIATEDKVICFNDLSSQMHMESPIEITEVEVSMPEKIKVDLSKCHYVGSCMNVSLRDVNGQANRVLFSVNNAEKMTISFSITLEYSSLEMKPVISVN